MNRGQLLASAAALALSGCDQMRAVCASARNGCLRYVGLPSTNGITVAYRTFESQHVSAPHQVAYGVAYPSDVDPKTIERVAYALPGRTGSAKDMLGTFAAFFAQIPQNAQRRWMLVSLDAGESYFHARARGEDRMALVTDEVPKMLARDFGVHPRREALLGVSMGGYGALLAAEVYRPRYCCVAVAGPAIFPSFADERSSVGDAFDDASDFAAHDVIGGAARLAHIPVLVRAGSKDPFVPGVRAFAARVPNADVQINAGCHDEMFWRSSAPAMIAFTAHNLAG
jgi:pimeloyl-ACP methyl ester carboxylesterase